MNIVFLLGNGFDINLGLKTKYSDFYEYYQKMPDNSELVKKLKSNIFNNVEYWSDLELALGKYTSEFESVADFDEVYEEIVNNLCDYLDEESKNYNFSALSQDVFFKDLCQAEKYLTVADISEFTDYQYKWRNSNTYINVINFNYTNSVKNILKDYKNPIVNYAEKRFYLNELIHIHGFTNERTILGVNDLSQVANENFHIDSDFIEALIKTESNSSQRHKVDKKCEELINTADMICIFGCSLGETDKFWWNLVANNLKRGMKVIIFYRTIEQNRRLGHKIVRVQKKVKKQFLDMSDLNDDEKEKFAQNLYIKINAEIFNLHNIEQDKSA